MTNPYAEYEETATRLTMRILSLFPEHPELLESREEDPWTLFDCREFNCDDIQPSLAQAAGALDAARGIWRVSHAKTE